MGRDPAIFLEPVSERLTCAICLDVLHEPTYVGCEQEHCFCKSCLTTHFDTNPTRSAFGESSLFRNSRLFSQGHFESFGGSPSSNTSARCPLDRQVVNSSRMKPAAFVARMIGDLKVKCPYEECAWTGLASDEHEFFCIHKIIVCSGCKQIMTEDIEEHQGVCEEVVVSCPRGHDRCGTLRRKQLVEHRQTCAFWQCRFVLPSGPCSHQATLYELHSHEDIHFLFDCHQPLMPDSPSERGSVSFIPTPSLAGTLRLRSDAALLEASRSTTSSFGSSSLPAPFGTGGFGPSSPFLRPVIPSTSTNTEHSHRTQALPTFSTAFGSSSSTTNEATSQPFGGPSISSGHTSNNTWANIAARIDARVVASQRERAGTPEYTFPTFESSVEREESSDDEDEAPELNMPGGAFFGQRREASQRSSATTGRAFSFGPEHFPPFQPPEPPVTASAFGPSAFGSSTFGTFNSSSFGAARSSPTSSFGSTSSPSAFNSGSSFFRPMTANSRPAFTFGSDSSSLGSGFGHSSSSSFSFGASRFSMPENRSSLSVEISAGDHSDGTPSPTSTSSRSESPDSEFRFARYTTLADPDPANAGILLPLPRTEGRPVRDASSHESAPASRSERAGTAAGGWRFGFR